MVSLNRTDNFALRSHPRPPDEKAAMGVTQTGLYKAGSKSRVDCPSL